MPAFGPQAGPGQPSPQQIAAMQQQLATEAQKRGMTVQQFQAQQRAALETDARKEGLTFDQYITKLKQQAFEQHQQQQRAQQQRAAQTGSPPDSPSGQEVPVNPGPPSPQALALAKWLRKQDLKTRTCILNGQRKDMFKVKRALRAIESPAYATAAAKADSNLPALSASMPSSEILKLLPLSLLALRVSKADEHEGHNHGPVKKAGKRVKGLWTVRIEQQQVISPELHYVFLHDGPQWRTKLYAAGALLAVFAVVLFPLWPITLRIGVWYCSMGMLGLIGLFFAMAIFRLILFCVTVFAVPPGLWLYPNLFEDVGFFDSFRPVWGWQETKSGKKAKAEKRGKTNGKGQVGGAENGHAKAPAQKASLLGSKTENADPAGGGTRRRRDLTPKVEEAEDD